MPPPATTIRSLAPAVIISFMSGRTRCCGYTPGAAKSTEGVGPRTLRNSAPPDERRPYTEQEVCNLAIFPDKMRRCSPPQLQKWMAQTDQSKTTISFTSINNNHHGAFWERKGYLPTAYCFAQSLLTLHDREITDYSKRSPAMTRPPSTPNPPSIKPHDSIIAEKRNRVVVRIESILRFTASKVR